MPACGGSESRSVLFAVNSIVTADLKFQNNLQALVAGLMENDKDWFG
ncbi:hypothetical protein N9F34_01840 [Alphaproteobacteria bacterium]|nr:hypothetical protein [Alphaproteobacteria bacterium]